MAAVPLVMSPPHCRSIIYNALEMGLQLMYPFKD